VDRKELKSIKSEIAGIKPLNLQYEKKIESPIDEDTVRKISKEKGEPEWMFRKRLESLKIFDSLPMPSWGLDLSSIVNFKELVPYAKPFSERTEESSKIPPEIMNVLEKLNIPEAERRYLSGSGTMLDSEVLYQRIKDELRKKGVIFTDMDTAVKEYPELVKKYFMTFIVTPHNNKFAALHGALWSGGSFVYVPKGVKVGLPLQVFFLINYPKLGQFEHTIIIADEGSEVEYIEGCSAPVYSTYNLHSAVVEVHVKKNAFVKYITIQTWTKNVLNLNTKRAIVEEGGTLRWISGNIGSGLTMYYPSAVLREKGARAEFLSITFAGKGQKKETGSKVFHLAPETKSRILSKSIVKSGGYTAYRGLVHVSKGAKGSTSSVKCDALLLDDLSESATYPYVELSEDDTEVTHEATVSKIEEEKLFYLMSRGLSENEAKAMITRGFMEPVMVNLPLEYALELNRFIELELEGEGVVG
jgi:Fe-S cluster assembly protein SufB